MAACTIALGAAAPAAPAAFRAPAGAVRRASPNPNSSSLVGSRVAGKLRGGSLVGRASEPAAAGDTATDGAAAGEGFEERLGVLRGKRSKRAAVDPAEKAAKAAAASAPEGAPSGGSSGGVASRAPRQKRKARGLLRTGTGPTLIRLLLLLLLLLLLRASG
jgi:hypothetical protein